MAKKNVNILLSLKDMFTPKLKGTTAEIRKQKREINAASKVIKGYATNANNRFKSVMGTAGRLARTVVTLGGVISVAGISTFAIKAEEGFNEAREAETKLAAVLQNVPDIIAKGAGAADAAKERLVAYTDALERSGVIAGDVSIAGLQQLGTFQLTEASLKKLTPGMADLLAQQKGVNATQADAVSIGNLVGKAMTGQTGALSKAGIIMTDYQKQVMTSGTEMERAAMLAEILKQNVGGVNEALAKTDAGKAAQAANLLGQATDIIGGKIAQIKGKFAELVTDNLPELESAATATADGIGSAFDWLSGWIDTHKEQISNACTTIQTVGKTTFDIVSGAVKFFMDHSSLLIPVLAGVVGGFVAFNVLSTIIPLVTTMTTVIKGAAAAGGIMNAVMAANPFILIAAAIAAVIAVIALLILNFDKVKAVAATVFGAMKNFVLTLKDAFVSSFQQIRDAIVGAFDYVKNKVKAVFDWFYDKIKWVIDGAKKIGDALGFGGGGSDDGGSGGGGQPRYPPYGGKALGTPYFKGGLTHINEGGRGEIVDLPNGTRIIPHDVAKKQGGGTQVVVNVTVQGNVIGNKAYMEETGNYVATKVIKALEVV